MHLLQGKAIQKLFQQLADPILIQGLAVSSDGFNAVVFPNPVILHLAKAEKHGIAEKV